MCYTPDSDSVLNAYKENENALLFTLKILLL